MKCASCRFALWDYETYHNIPDPCWFVDGCQKCMDIDGETEECEEYEENK